MLHVMVLDTREGFFMSFFFNIFVIFNDFWVLKLCFVFDTVFITSNNHQILRKNIPKGIIYWKNSSLILIQYLTSIIITTYKITKYLLLLCYFPTAAFIFVSEAEAAVVCHSS